MTYFLTPRKTASTTIIGALSRAFTRMSDAVAEFRNPNVSPTTQDIAHPVAEPVDAFDSQTLPAVEDIEAAASLYFRAADQARTADRAKRKAKKVLDLLPVGRHGAWEVERVPSGRETVDLEAVRKLFKEHGLGAVPMRTSAPSLKVRKVELTSTAMTTVQVPADPHQLCERHACEDCGTELDMCDMQHDEDRDEWQCANCADSPSSEDARAYRSYAFSAMTR